jgi:transposase-like protein
MNKSDKNTDYAQWKYRRIHCPICDDENVKLVGGKGRFVGNVGGMSVCYVCKNCNSNFSMTITGDEMFPNLGRPA